MHKQLTLDVNLPQSHQFNTFYAGNNQQICYTLQSWLCGNIAEHCFYIWGKSHSGKSHLLKACCHFAVEKGLRVIYLPATSIESMTQNILAGLNNFDFVAIDDLDFLLQIGGYEQSLFNLYEDFQNRGAYLLVSAHTPPKNLHCCLADLQSRLSMAVIYQLQYLSDEEKIIALQKHAHHCGLKLNITAAQYLIHHCNRSIQELVWTLNLLAQISLEQKKKITLPFIRKVWPELERQKNLHNF